MRNNKGITMAALLITIIVMLILLAVSTEIIINGDIIGTTKQARNETNNKVAEQEGKVADLMDKWEDITDGKYLGLSSTEKEALKKAGGTEKRLNYISNENLKDTTKIKTVITDTGGGEVPIPVGATYVEGTENTGVVIQYKRSQFVWVPVPNAIYDGTTTITGVQGNSTDYYPMARTSTGTYAGTTEGITNYEGVLYDYSGTGASSKSAQKNNYGQNYRNGSGTPTFAEPFDLRRTSDGDWSTTANQGINLIKTHIPGYSTKTNEEIKTGWFAQLQGEYNKMVDSVNKYGGFYVGRYETSINVATGVASIEGVLPMGANTTPATTAGESWYGMYQKQKNFSGSVETDTMQSSMIWGSQWDAMLNWMLTGTEKVKVTSSSNANHSGSSNANTGAKNTDVINEIYDLEGNCKELTLEGWSTFARCYRGAAWYESSGVNATSTGSVRPWKTESKFASRLTLYIK